MSIDKMEIFKKMVRNALDFLECSIEDIESRPKFAVINFCNAVELFLKARLVLEHWVLIVDNKNKEDINVDKFLSGDFVSVSLDRAETRLRNIVGQPISKKYYQQFKKLKKHRNQLIHFYSEDFAAKTPTDGTKQKVTLEICRGLYFLNNLLREKWDQEFSEFESQIDNLNVHLNDLQKYLNVKYEEIKPDIEEAMKKGAVFRKCPSCTFDSAKQTQVLDMLFEENCLVCAMLRRMLNTFCPNCGKDILIYENDVWKCDKCNRIIAIKDMIESLESPIREKDDSISPSAAYCNYCEERDIHTVVPFNTKWLCLQCFEVHENAGFCEWCNEPVTGDLTDSYIGGCAFCGGKWGWETEKDKF